MTPSQAKRRPKKNPKRPPRECYSKDSYARAIRRARDKYEIPRWHPHQLRHTFTTKAREEFGLGVAQAILGHRTVRVTEHYARIQVEKAVEAVRDTGWMT